ncbi:MAG: HIRAN domain-containing protein [Gammaproteobacteria bacterium]|nr:HIRAN domain-containing protein [Gammaproteobacteria bacterium]
MKRRTFFRRLFGGLGAAVTSPAVDAKDRTVLIQESPIAGFQFHSGDSIWSSLGVGDELALVRESSNSHDPDAVAVYFQDDKLGYVPRAENSAIAQMLDRGETLEARISKLMTEEDPWERIRFTISLV